MYVYLYIYIHMYIYIYMYIYVYAQRLGFAPALPPTGFLFPFPIECCCNFRFNWEDQQRY